MKRWFAIILLAGVLTQSMSKLLVYVNYRVNENHITAHLCVNRDKPMSCCHGKCQLTKQLNKTEDGTKGTTPQRVSIADYVSFYSEATPLSISPLLIYTSLGFAHEADYSFIAITYIAHPPTV